MAIYALEIWHTKGKAVVPGIPLETDQLFRSASPIPVPEVGEAVAVGGKAWKVRRRRFSYDYEKDTNEPAVLVELYYDPIGDDEWHKTGKSG